MESLLHVKVSYVSPSPTRSHRSIYHPTSTPNPKLTSTKRRLTHIFGITLILYLLMRQVKGDHLQVLLSQLLSLIK